MTPPPIEREAVFPRISGIQKNLNKLQNLARLPEKEFSKDDNYDLAQHHLRLALEGVFHISSHILSRLPGGRAVEYKEIARKMGETKVLPQDFVDRALIPMAGMRNLLVHYYADIKPKKLHDILKNHLPDIELFLKHIKAVLESPDRLGLSLG